MDSLYSTSVFDYTVQTFNSGRFQIWIFEIFHVKGLILKKYLPTLKNSNFCRSCPGTKIFCQLPFLNTIPTCLKDLQNTNPKGQADLAHPSPNLDAVKDHRCVSLRRRLTTSAKKLDL
jgi:hypothetical protein